MTNLFPRLGIADKVKVKMTARGTESTAMVAKGEADLAVMPISEIFHAGNVDLAGVLPADIQFLQTFSAAIVAGSSEIEGARRLIEFLSSAAASDAIKRSGLEPAGAAK
jgi:molybdate transport system substrate-binding protein